MRESLREAELPQPNPRLRLGPAAVALRPQLRAVADGSQNGDMQYTTKREAVAEWLRSEILRGALAPGTQLQQDEIARRLGLSPTPVREAFSLLIAEGLLVGRPHRGVVIAPAYAGETHEIYAVRAFVEGMAASRAAQGLSAAAQAEFEALNARTAAAMKRGDLYAFRRGSARFHEVIGEASGSRILAELMKTLMSRVQSVPLDRRRMRKLQDEHVQLLELLKAGDSENVAEVIRKHVEVSVIPLRADGSVRSKPLRRPRKRSS